MQKVVEAGEFDLKIEILCVESWKLKVKNWKSIMQKIANYFSVKSFLVLINHHRLFSPGTKRFIKTGKVFKERELLFFAR